MAVAQSPESSLDPAELLAREQERNRQLQRLAQASIAINATLSVEAMLDTVTREAREIVGAHQAVASLCNGEDWAQSVTSVSLSERYAAWREYHSEPDGTGIYSLVCTERRPIRLTQAQLEAHPRWRGFGTEKDRHPPMRGWLAVPFIGREGQVIGLLQLSDKYDGEFSEADEAIAVQLAQLAASCLENARLYAQARASEEQHRRAEDEIRMIAARAHCLMWHAEIQECGTPDLHWKLRILDAEAAQRFLPLDLTGGRSYANAWYWSRPDEDRLASDLYGDAQVRLGRSYRQEFRCRDMHGELHWLREEVEIETLAPGRWRAVGICTDITERQEWEEQLRQAQKMEAVGRLAGGVAHDFNNMLAVINGYAEVLLARDDLDETLCASLERVKQAGERAAALTRQLLAFSRKQLVRPQLLDPNAVIGDTELMLRTLIGEDIELVTRLDPAVGRIRVDRSQLDQILLNLVINARDALPTGGRILLETAEEVIPASEPSPALRVPSGEYVVLTVTDNGHGMDADTLSHIWEPFFSTKGEAGTGLGLATVYGIVRQNDGHAVVESRPGQGTRFRLYLPRAEGEQAAADPEQEHPASARGGETVLVVEDEDMVRGLVRRVLQAAGYQVLEASDGTEGLRLLATHGARIDLLLTDVVLPGGLSGRALVERAQELHPQLRILFVSGYTDDAILRHGVETDACAFLQKPFSPAALTAKVREVLQPEN